MSSTELQDLQTHITSLDSKYKFEKLCSSTILKELTLDSREVIFIYKEPLKNVVNGDIKVEIFSNITDTEVKLEGNPLPAPFSQSDLTLGEELIGNTTQHSTKQIIKYAPVELQHARGILSKINTGIITLSLPVYILTNGEDYQKTILIGSERDENGWVTSLSANITDAFIEGNNKSFVDQLIENHTKKSYMSPFELKSTVKSTFLIQGVTEDNTVELHLTWDTPTMEVPVSEASTDLLLTCKLDSEVSLGLWQDLQRLVNFTQMIKSWKNDSTQDVSYERMNAVLNPGSSSDSSVDIQSRLVDIIEENKHSYNVTETRRKKPASSAATNASGTTGDVFDVSLAQVSTQVIRGERTTLDLSDKLWTVLSECTTYKELKCTTYKELSTSFQLVFQKIRANIQEGCKVNILGKKSARFVCAVRNLLKGDYSNPEYWDKLEILVEMGIEKLINDYSYIFLKTNLVYEDQLLPPTHIPKFSEMSGDEWGSHMQNYLDYLARLHTILSIILQVDDCIKLPHTALSHLTLATFDKVCITYDQAENNACRYHYTCPISTLSVKKFVTGSKLFSTWSLHLSHENKNRKMSTSSLLTMNPLLIHPVAEQDNKEDADMNVTLSRLSPFQHYCLRTNCSKFGTSK
ncbi:hypothetical protein M8J75_014897 [Diaphorina citri]|nr:hypothetical protein M8J75_014897 [Diaphorina citri]KAI5728921.1 hypothetical protein M8J77_023311 [Diaphorina citri]